MNFLTPIHKTNSLKNHLLSLAYRRQLNRLIENRFSQSAKRCWHGGLVISLIKTRFGQFGDQLMGRGGWMYGGGKRVKGIARRVGMGRVERRGVWLGRG